MHLSGQHVQVTLLQYEMSDTLSREGEDTSNCGNLSTSHALIVDCVCTALFMAVIFWAAGQNECGRGRGNHIDMLAHAFQLNAESCGARSHLPCPTDRDCCDQIRTDLT